jgi:orotate phosphoribosyltransferase
MAPLVNIGERLADFALECGAFYLRPDKPVTWASGYRMPVYTDNRVLLRFPTGRALVREALAQEAAGDLSQADFVAGTASAGIAPALLLAQDGEKPFLYVRSAAKEHGLARRIEGLTRRESELPEPLAGRRVLLVEDLLSTGKSSAAAARALMDAGAEVPLCIAIFSYGFPKLTETFASLPQECQARSVLTIETLLARARARGDLEEGAVASIKEWQVDPFGWQERHG